MSSPRFLAIIAPGNSTAKSRARSIAEDAVSHLGFRIILDSAGIVMLADTSTPVTSLGERAGAVVGSIFHRNPLDRRLAAWDREICDRALASGGASLFDDCWGNYVAFVVEAETNAVHVLRDPCGTVSTFHHDASELSFHYSDLEIPIALELIEPEIDWSVVGQHLAFGTMRSPDTAISGVGDLLPGSRRTYTPAGARTMMCWSPWRFTARELALIDPADAIDELRATAQGCASALTSGHRSVLVELSGGLDSSIVATCLSGGDAEVRCVTLVTPDPGADERRYASLVARAIGAELHEAHLNVAGQPLTWTSPRRRPRPGNGPLHNSFDRHFAAVAAEIGTDAFFSGGGGDNVFCALKTAAPAADAFWSLGPGQFAETIGDLSSLHNCTPWKAGRLALRKTIRGERRRKPKGDFIFVDKVTPPANPWWTTPKRALPGKAEHLKLIIATQNAQEASDRTAIAPIHYPLLSQPVMELCLRIPTWLWISGGRDRAIAREAFAPVLPSEIVQRRTKGNFRRYCAAIFEHRRSELHELLLDGVCARAGLVDQSAIESFLAAPPGTSESLDQRLLEIAGVENWARSWAA